MPPQDPLLAGSAQVCITPPLGTQLAGDIGRRRPAETVLDPRYARALSLRRGETQVCILALDLLSVGDTCVHELRRRAEAQAGIPAPCVMVHSSQTHAAPTLGHLNITEPTPHVPEGCDWIRGGDDGYIELALRGAVEAISQAKERLTPVSVGWAGGVESRVAFNRRFVMRDGTAKTHPGAADLANVLHVEGPTDPEVGLLCLTRDDLTLAGALLHHTCHPTHGYPHRFVTADWPGLWAEAFRRTGAGEFSALTLNGCCGNIAHVNHLDPAHPIGTDVMVSCLMETTEGLRRNLRHDGAATLATASRVVEVPLRRLDREDVAAAEALLQANPEPMWLDEAHTSVAWDWVYALSNLDLERTGRSRPTYPMEVQAIRIGDVALVGVPGEPFVEGQLQIKQQSPAKRTFVSHMSNGHAGYIPTPAALGRGGYETRTCNWSRLAPEALEAMVTAAREALELLF